MPVQATDLAAHIKVLDAKKRKAERTCKERFARKMTVWHESVVWGMSGSRRDWTTATHCSPACNVAVQTVKRQVLVMSTLFYGI